MIWRQIDSLQCLWISFYRNQSSLTMHHDEGSCWSGQVSRESRSTVLRAITNGERCFFSWQQIQTSWIVSTTTATTKVIVLEWQQIQQLWKISNIVTILSSCASLFMKKQDNPHHVHCQSSSIRNTTLKQLFEPLSPINCELTKNDFELPALSCGHCKAKHWNQQTKPLSIDWLINSSAGKMKVLRLLPVTRRKRSFWCQWISNFVSFIYLSKDAKKPIPIPFEEERTSSENKAFIEHIIAQHSWLTSALVLFTFLKSF